MTAGLQTVILIALGGLFLWPHEYLMQTWDVMFALIVVSMLIAATGSFFIFRYTLRHSVNRMQVILGSVVGTAFFGAAWFILWAVSEEALIHFSRWHWGPDDTGNRYFYPGNSGMGYASGLLNPLKTLWQSIIFGIIPGILLGLPFGMAAQLTNKTGEQVAAPDGE